MRDVLCNTFCSMRERTHADTSNANDSAHGDVQKSTHEKNPACLCTNVHHGEVPISLLHQLKEVSSFKVRNCDLIVFLHSMPTTPASVNPVGVRGGRVVYQSYMGFPTFGVPYWGPYSMGILLFGDLYCGPLIFAKPPTYRCSRPLGPGGTHARWLQGWSSHG